MAARTISLLDILLPFLILFPVLLCANETSQTGSPCSYSKDKTYGGVKVDCNARGLLSLPDPTWLPRNTTVLILDSNSISKIGGNYIAMIAELRVLSLSYNRIDAIDPEAFRHSGKLRFLNLVGNRIRLDSAGVAKPMFRYLHNLNELRLEQNGNKGRGVVDRVSYPEDLLLGLINLRVLWLDTFSGDLKFSGIFNNTPNLTVLSLSGGFRTIKNETFQGFESIKLTILRITKAFNFIVAEHGAFNSLLYLYDFRFFFNALGTEPLLRSLAPFVHRNFTSLNIRNLQKNERSPSAHRENFELTKKMSQYLSKICVRDFIFRDNDLFYIDVGTLVNPVWANCLVNLDLSGNPIMGDIFELLRLNTMQVLQNFNLRNRKYSYIKRKNKILNTYGLDNVPVLGLLAMSADGWFGVPGGGHNDLPRWFETFDPRETNCDLCGPFASDTSVSRTKRDNSADSDTIGNTEGEVDLRETGRDSMNSTLYGLRNTSHNSNSNNYMLIIRFPKELTYFNIESFSDNTGPLDKETRVLGADRLREIHVSDCGLRTMTAKIHGLDQLTVLDISKNDGSQVTRSFMESYPNLSTLNMSRMGLSKIIESSGAESVFIFGAQVRLETLDLSYNGFFYLPDGLFSENKILRDLYLRGNRFTALPFTKRIPPSFYTLDMRSNALLTLSTEQMSMVEKHARAVKSFKLLLNGNVFSCGCGSIRFMKWLANNGLFLDTDQHYPCLLENGHVTAVGDINIIGLWRHCNGEQAFLISLIFLCFVILGFCLAFLVIKFKTQLKIIVMQFFNSTLAMKTRKDYALDVYIGYASQDSTFACITLRSLLENDFRLTTYAKDINLLPGRDMSESIAQATHSSWRILLVVTDAFLRDSWSQFTMRLAALSVTPVNPRRLVIAVTLDDTSIGDIPMAIMECVREDQIVILSTTRQEHLFEDEIKALREALA